jgi:hypothetical protein
MSGRFAAGKRALAECDVCGRTCKLNSLKNVIVKGRDTNLKSCRECWDPDHPQLRVGERPVFDPQALRNPRPDSAGYGQSRELVMPVAQVVGTLFIGQVTVTTA